MKHIALALIFTVAIFGCKSPETESQNEESEAFSTGGSTTTTEFAESSPSHNSDATESSDENTTETAAEPRYEKLDLAEVQKIASQIPRSARTMELREGQGDHYHEPPVKELRHPAFKGPLGPWPDGVVALDDVDSHLVSAWVFAEKDGEPHAWRFAHQTGNVIEVTAIFFEDLGDDGDQDIFVSYVWMIGHGLEAARDRYQTIAFEWDQQAQDFSVRDDLFDSFDNPPKTAAEARKRLRDRGLIAE